MDSFKKILTSMICSWFIMQLEMADQAAMLLIRNLAAQGLGFTTLCFLIKPPFF